MSRWLVGGALVAAALTLAAPAWAAGWQKVLSQDGVTVFAKGVPGRDLPMLRGRAVLDASPYEILAVLQDHTRHCEWMRYCASVRLLEQTADNERYLYNRTDPPLPASDRDVVLKTRFRIVAQGTRIETFFVSTRHRKAPKTDAVRIPRLRGHYKLTAIAGGKTRVEYQVDSDPGGDAPHWLVAKESKSMPLEMLRNLRSQVASTRGRYQGFVAKWKARGVYPPQD